ncbi:MAG TPA: pseudouridine synthase [Planctomycetaceae bacterium]|nr:pseudouridine synthase [Planctomycetaceae bacterium]
MPERPSPPEPETRPIRLQRFLASAGYGSRRACEEFILQGRVTVDGQDVTDLGTKVDPERQDVRVDGERVRPERKRYFLLNKPSGYVSTSRDPRGRPRAIDLVPDARARLFTVGRLDENSQGLMLVTNDGDLAERLAHPRYGVPRRYRVQVVGRPTGETLAQLKRGLHFSDGRFRVHEAKIVGSKGGSTFLELVLRQGQNREIRRLLARAGHKVIFLERIGFGPLRLGRLGRGKSRPLLPSEVKTLREYIERPRDGSEQRPGGKRRVRRNPPRRGGTGKP